ncbi:MAG: hypothetical protein L0338_11625 [Acidobacteria bacterium]|nr:hypothetical protein [Acidobacteriota bacterium]
MKLAILTQSEVVQNGRRHNILKECHFAQLSGALATAAGVGTGQLLQPLAYTSGLAKGSDSDFDGTLGAFCGLKSTLELHTGVSHTTAAALRQMKKII